MSMHREIINLAWVRGDRLPVVVLEVFTEPPDWDGTEATLVPYDLTGRDVAAYIKRQEVDADSSALAALTLANDGLVWDQAAVNEVQIHPTQPSTAVDGDFSWRLVVTENGKPMTPVYGRWTVTPV